MSEAIRTTIDGAGRLVIPKAIRDEAGLEPGSSLEVSHRNGQIVIEPALRKVRLGRRGRLTIALPADEDQTPLTGDTIRAVAGSLRKERGS
ncbi:MAG TPA: AbrB/MazE/SpoVT family DNA-binding domain-containing protein [Thermoanaerobaculia bacterium]|nr:AbrB/MazE/SpoVT family DNA-binding domain-containing protein [Thermoanaerobaculia bacterium]